jgi:23S rRNA (cytosine1962-C5)-methyltransferase
LADISLHTPEHWADYELIDSGGLEKLERFGKYILTRPEPQAVWAKSLPEEEWRKQSNAIYKRTRGVDPSSSEYVDKGDWQRKPGMPDQWNIGYSMGKTGLKFRLGLTSFGHVGIFPEQAVNWEFIFRFIGSAVRGSQFDIRHSNEMIENRKSKIEKPASSAQHPVSGIRVLNLFAYTGAASLAAKAAGADVVHVDSVKPVINWAKEDMELSGLKDIRWVVEDALKFVRREVKRGNKYNGIILDPPAYGRGPEGEKWVLQESINEMIGLCSELLLDKNSFFIASLYSMGFSALISESLVKTHFGTVKEQELGELYFADRAGRKLPLGTYLRFIR